MSTIEQLETRINKLSSDQTAIKDQLNKITTNLNTKIDNSDLLRNVEELRGLINDCNTTIAMLENKLSKVILPEETRYYLKEGEVSSFQSNFNTLRAMMSNLDQLTKNIISYQTNLSNSNSI